MNGPALRPLVVRGAVRLDHTARTIAILAEHHVRAVESRHNDRGERLPTQTAQRRSARAYSGKAMRAGSGSSRLSLLKT